MCCNLAFLTDRGKLYICPAADFALAKIPEIRIIICYYCTVSFQTCDMFSSGSNSNHIGPVVYSLIIITHIRVGRMIVAELIKTIIELPLCNHHCSIGFQSHRNIVSRADCNNIFSIADAVPIIVIQFISGADGRHHRTIGFQAYGMDASCADCDDVGPVADLALTIFI